MDGSCNKIKKRSGTVQTGGIFCIFIFLFFRDFLFYIVFVCFSVLFRNINIMLRVVILKTFINGGHVLFKRFFNLRNVRELKIPGSPAFNNKGFSPKEESGCFFCFLTEEFMSIMTVLIKQVMNELLIILEAL